MRCGKPPEPTVLMRCLSCDHVQDFAKSLVKHGTAMGVCTNERRQTRWTFPEMPLRMQIHAARLQLEATCLELQRTLERFRKLDERFNR